MEILRNLSISNYKSINSINLSCNRVNVLIGEPNVGKSNILEALDLSYLSWMFLTNENSHSEIGRNIIDFKEFFRVDSVADLFHLGNLKKPISLNFWGYCPDFQVRIVNSTEQEYDSNKALFKWETTNSSETIFDKHFIPKTKTNFYGSPIKPFRYKDNVHFYGESSYLHHLMPPYGNSLIDTIHYNPHLREFIDEITKDTGIEFNLDKASQKISIQLRVADRVVYPIPYKALADTFRRLLFYVAAIRCTNGGIITLEEPEAHSFPRYVSLMADEIIAAKELQFFIATHSPYLLNELIEKTTEGELGVFVCGYDKEKHETKINKLSSEQLSELLDYGVDIFFNINRYLDDRVEHRS